MRTSALPPNEHSDPFYHWFAYYYGLRDGRRLKPHHVRDGAAVAELGALLGRRGFRYGRLLRNGPPTPEQYEAQKKAFDSVSEGGPRRIEEIAAYTPVDESFLRPGDVLVVPTRLPMDDLHHANKVHSQPGFTSIEQKIFRIVRRYLALCSRAYISLAPEVAVQLREGFANRAAVTFYQVKEPWYRTLKRLDGGDFVDLSGRRRPKNGTRQTAGYVLYLPEVESLNGAGLLMAFGVGGTQTLVICHRLRTDLAWLLEEPGFTMVEMTAKDEEPARDGLEFADEWKMEVVLHMKPLE